MTEITIKAEQVKQARANETNEEQISRQHKEKIRSQHSRASETNEEQNLRQEKNKIRMQCSRAEENQQKSHKKPRMSNIVLTTVGPSKDEIEELVKDAIAQTIRTRRDDRSHQATVCVVCDRVIIGTEPVHMMTKERILVNEKRLSVKTYEDFYNNDMHPILKKTVSS